MARSGWGRRAGLALAVTLAAAVLAGCGLVGGDSTEAFCDAAKDLSSLGEQTELDVQVSSADSPAEAEAKLQAAEQQFEELATKAEDLLDRLEREAPGEIRDDVETVVSFTRAFFSGIRSGTPDADPPALGDMSELGAASERVQAYVKKECGVELEPTGVDMSVPSIPELPTPSIPFPTSPSAPSAPSP